MTRGMRFMLLSTLFFGVMGVLVKHAQRTVPHEVVVFARGAVTLVMSAWSVWRLRLPVKGNNTRLLLLRGLTGFIGLNCYFYSLGVLPLGDAVTLQFINPVLTTLLAALVLREPLHRANLLALVLCMAGIVLVAQPGFLFGAGASALAPLGVAAALTGACSSAAAYVMVRKLGETDHAALVVLWFPVVAVPLSIPGVLSAGTWPSAMDVLVLVAMGAVTQTAQVFMTRGLALERAGPATTVTTLQVPMSYVLGLMLFGEKVRPSALAGAMLVMTGVWVAATRKGPAARA